MSEPIEFQATVYKVQTLVDMGLRVTLDLPEDAIPEMAMLAECKRQGIVLSVKCEADTNGKPNDTDRHQNRKF